MGAAYRPALRLSRRRWSGVLPRVLSIRAFFFTVVVVCAALASPIVGLQGAATAPSHASLFWTPTVTPTPTATPPTYQCFRPTDVMIAFDLSDSMDQSGKLSAASTAAQNFVQRFIDNNPSPDPHHMGLATLKNGVASVNVTIGSNLNTVKSTLATFDSSSDTSGYTNIGEALWRAEAQLAPNRPTIPDFIILSSAGAANRPDDLDDPSGTTETNDDVWLDVNDDGVVNSADDLTVDFKGNGDNDFVVVDGRLTWDTAKRALDATESGSLRHSHDSDPGPRR